MKQVFSSFQSKFFAANKQSRKLKAVNLSQKVSFIGHDLFFCENDHRPWKRIDFRLFFEICPGWPWGRGDTREKQMKDFILFRSIKRNGERQGWEELRWSPAFVPLHFMKVRHNDHWDDKESPFLKSGPFKRALPKKLLPPYPPLSNGHFMKVRHNCH